MRLPCLRVARPLRAVQLKCLVLASKANEVDWLIGTLVPCMCSFSRLGAEKRPEYDEAVFEVRSWLGRPALRSQALILLPVIHPPAAGGECSGFWTPPRPVEVVKRTRCAFTLASWVLNENKESLSEDKVVSGVSPVC